MLGILFEVHFTMVTISDESNDLFIYVDFTTVKCQKLQSNSSKFLR